METKTLKIVVIAAMKEEIAPLMQLFSGAIPVLQKRKTLQVEHKRGRCSFFVTGIGRKNVVRAKAALRACVAHADLVIVTGVCGALEPAARIGDTLICTEALAEKKPSLELPAASLYLPPCVQELRRGAFLTSDRFADHVEKKRLSAAFGHAVCVDMETYFLAEILQVSGAPFMVIKSVSDTASARLPDQDFVARHYGAASWRSSLRVCIRHPLRSFWLVGLKRGFRRAVGANSARVKKIIEKVYDDHNP